MNRKVLITGATGDTGRAAVKESIALGLTVRATEPDFKTIADFRRDNRAAFSRHETVDGDHGRIETRTDTAIHDVEWLQKRHDWPGLQGVELGPRIAISVAILPFLRATSDCSNAPMISSCLSWEMGP